MASIKSDTNSRVGPIERSQLNLSPGTTEVVETFSENTLPPNNCSQHSYQLAADLSFSDRVGRASVSSVKHVSTGTGRNESNESNLQSGFNEMAEPSLNSSVSASLADQLFTPSTKKEVNIAMKNKDLLQEGSAKSMFGFDVFSNRGERVSAPSISERSACLDSQSHVDLSSIDKSGSLVYLQHSTISSPQAVHRASTRKSRDPNSPSQWRRVLDVRSSRASNSNLSFNINDSHESVDIIRQIMENNRGTSEEEHPEWASLVKQTANSAYNSSAYNSPISLSNIMKEPLADQNLFNTSNNHSKVFVSSKTSELSLPVEREDSHLNHSMQLESCKSLANRSPSEPVPEDKPTSASSSALGEELISCVESNLKTKDSQLMVQKEIGVVDRTDISIANISPIPVCLGSHIFQGPTDQVERPTNLLPSSKEPKAKSVTFATNETIISQKTLPEKREGAPAAKILKQDVNTQKFGAQHAEPGVNLNKTMQYAGMSSQSESSQGEGQKGKPAPVIPVSLLSSQPQVKMELVDELLSFSQQSMNDTNLQNKQTCFSDIKVELK